MTRLVNALGFHRIHLLSVSYEEVSNSWDINCLLWQQRSTTEETCRQLEGLSTGDALVRPREARENSKKVYTIYGLDV